MDNLDSFLSEESGEAAPEVEVTEAPAEVVETQETETEDAKAQRERDEKGRFKAKEADEPVMVPLKALHETRDEVKALKEQLTALQRPQEAPQPQAVPDVFEDPQGYTAYIQDQIAKTTLNDRLNLSEELIRASAGDEAVNAAQEWGRQVLASNPMFAQAFYSQRNPYGFLVSEYKRQTTLAEIGNDPSELEAFRAWKQQQSAAPAPSSAPAVPSTLADAQSARGSTAAGVHVPSFDEILGRSSA